VLPGFFRQLLCLTCEGPEPESSLWGDSVVHWLTMCSSCAVRYFSTASCAGKGQLRQLCRRQHAAELSDVTARQAGRGWLQAGTVECQASRVECQAGRLGCQAGAGDQECTAVRGALGQARHRPTVLGLCQQLEVQVLIPLPCVLQLLLLLPPRLLLLRLLLELCRVAAPAAAAAAWVAPFLPL